MKQSPKPLALAYPRPYHRPLPPETPPWWMRLPDITAEQLLAFLLLLLLMVVALIATLLAGIVPPGLGALT